MSSLDVDRHVRRTGDDYVPALANEMPSGVAWPRDLAKALMKAVTGLAQIWGFFDGRAADFLEIEADPRTTIELLADWEKAFGLPDPCIASPQTIDDRRVALVQRMTMIGGQSIPFFVDAAKRIGYDITITEYAPFMVGITPAGDTRAQYDGVHQRWQIGPPEIRFYWTVHVMNAKLSWFRAGSGQAGVDPHLRIGLATDLECLIRRWKPAHTIVLFDYSGLATGGSMAGLP